MSAFCVMGLKRFDQGLVPSCLYGKLYRPIMEAITTALLFIFYNLYTVSTYAER